MNIVGMIIFCVAGALFLWGGIKKKKEEPDYSRYPTVQALLIGTEDMGGSRWIVEFPDEEGKEVLGADDRIAATVFHPEKYHMPAKKTKEMVYYWKYDGFNHLSINGKPVEYWIHFCDESLYDVLNKKLRQEKAFMAILGVLLIFGGILILLFG